MFLAHCWHLSGFGLHKEGLGSNGEGHGKGWTDMLNPWLGWEGPLSFSCVIVAIISWLRHITLCSACETASSLDTTAHRIRSTPFAGTRSRSRSHLQVSKARRLFTL